MNGKRKPVKKGGGPPPGYEWNIDILDQAFAEAMSFLDQDQYDHLARQVQEVARQQDATHSDTVDIRPIEDYYEIRDKGGILQKINARVFFCVHKPSKTMAVLGAFNKKNDGATPVAIRITMRRRMREYLKKYHS